MPANEEPQAKISLHTPIDVVASIPYMLGFAPTNSFVFVFVNQVTKRHALTSRFDYPPLQGVAHEFEQLQVVCSQGQFHGATAVHAVIYPGTEPDFEQFAELACHAAELIGLEVISAGSVRDGYWTDLLDPDSVPLEIASAGVDAACSWIEQNRSYLPDRASLEACVTGAPTELAVEVDRLYEQWPEVADQLRTASGRRDVEDAILSHLQSEAAIAVAPHDLATWLVALPDRRVREPILFRLAQPNNMQRSDQIVERLARIVRNAPDYVAAAASSVLAAFAWQTGNGALALIAASHALDCDPANKLADLILAGISQSAPPSAWLEVLQSMNIGELRAGRLKDRTVSRPPHPQAKQPYPSARRPA